MAISVQPQPGVPAPAPAQQPAQQPAPVYQVTQEQQQGYPRDNLPQNQFAQRPPQQQPVQGQPQQPLQQPPQPQNGQPPVQLGPDTVLDGPGVPQELRGKTMQQAMQMYSGMRQVVLDRFGQPQQAPQVQPPQQQPQAQQQPAPQPQQPGQNFDWRKPDESIGRIVESRVADVVNKALQPLIQQRQQESLAQVHGQVAAQFPDFAQHEAAIMQIVQGADPQMLQNPQTWEAAYYIAKGRAGGFNQAPVGTRQGPPSGVPATVPAPVQSGYPPQYVGQGQPMPFFTEAPQAPSVGPSTGLSAQEKAIAGAMGMTEADYNLWKGGVAR